MLAQLFPGFAGKVGMAETSVQRAEKAGSWRTELSNPRDIHPRALVQRLTMVRHSVFQICCTGCYCRQHSIELKNFFRIISSEWDYLVKISCNEIYIPFLAYFTQ